MAKGSFSLSFAAAAGISYTVHYNNSLSDPTWINLETVVGKGGILMITDADIAQRGARFYRVILTP
jgi:hypothetical protein